MMHLSEVTKSSTDKTNLLLLSFCDLHCLAKNFIVATTLTILVQFEILSSKVVIKELEGLLNLDVCTVIDVLISGSPSGTSGTLKYKPILCLAATGNVGHLSTVTLLRYHRR